MSPLSHIMGEGLGGEGKDLSQNWDAPGFYPEIAITNNINQLKIGCFLNMNFHQI